MKPLLVDPGTLCACGCGETIPPSRGHHYYATRYIRGHNMRVNPGARHVYATAPDEIPSGLCECGCGGATPVATVTNRQWRWFKGHPKPFIPGHHANRSARRPLLRDGVTFTDAQAAYLAGIIDGEGCISLRGNSVRVSIGSTSMALIEWLQQFGGSVSGQAPKPNRRPGWSWSVGHRADSALILRAALPYLTIKCDQAIAALDLLDSLPVRHR